MLSARVSVVFERCVAAPLRASRDARYLAAFGIGGAQRQAGLPSYPPRYPKTPNPSVLDKVWVEFLNSRAYEP